MRSLKRAALASLFVPALAVAQGAPDPKPLGGFTLLCVTPSKPGAQTEPFSMTLRVNPVVQTIHIALSQNGHAHRDYEVSARPGYGTSSVQISGTSFDLFGGSRPSRVRGASRQLRISGHSLSVLRINKETSIDLRLLELDGGKGFTVSSLVTGFALHTNYGGKFPLPLQAHPEAVGAVCNPI